MSTLYRAIFCLALCASLCLQARAAAAQGEDAAMAAAASGGAAQEYVTCGDGTIKIDAASVKPEDLIREIGEKCGIKVVIFGEAFDEKPIGVKFQPQPIRKGIERVLRIANLSNFVLHFDNNTTSPRIAELDIMGKKGGERQLTSGAPKVAPAPAAFPGAPLAPGLPPAKIPGLPVPKKTEKAEKTDKPGVTNPKESMTEKTQEDFMRVMDEMMKAQEAGEEPDPAEVLRIFKEVVPPEIREQIPPDVLKEIEEFEKNPQQGMPGQLKK